MINKKLLSGILCVVFLLSTLSVSALTFSDVENDPSVAWAKPYINSMADAGYLKGYEDGTFKPNNTISKTEALILLSRMIGVNDESFSDSVELAVEEFKGTLSKYSTNFAKEVSFLLYAGVIKADELGSYLSSSNKNAPLLRYEAAILLTKLLGAEAEVQGNAFVSSSYADTIEIPDSARAYVEYVKEKGIMQGMGNNKDGQPEFWPNTAVTRSQMAKMLHSLIDVLDLSVQTGVVVGVDEFESTITATVNENDIVYTVTDFTKFKINGKDAALEDMVEGMNVKITHLAGSLSMVENYVNVEDSVIYGIVSSVRNATGVKSVTIADANDTKNVETYVLADDVTIRVNGAIDTFSKVKTNNYVSLVLEDGLVAELSVIDKSSSAGGVLVSVDASSENTILNIEEASGETVAYEISADGVVVSRNNLDSNISALMVGDSIALKLTYGKVTRIQATSKNQTMSGSISYITHSTSGSLVGIDVKGKVTEYKINKSAKFIIDSVETGSVYDLRPGTDVNIGLQSSEIISIEAAGTASKSQLFGTIKSINTSYGLIIVEEEGVDYNVFVNTNTQIFDSKAGKTVQFKSIEKGRTATVTGSNASGVLEASVIVLQ